MFKNKPHSVTVIVRSCLTGQVVWIYRGASKRSADSTYCRACQCEVERVRHWSRIAARRKANILRLLSECMAGMAIDGVMTPEQKAAAKRLTSMAEDPGCYREFYDHIMEERRRRARDKKIRQQMREREAVGNRNYDKREGEG